MTRRAHRDPETKRDQPSGAPHDVSRSDRGEDLLVRGSVVDEFDCPESGP